MKANTKVMDALNQVSVTANKLILIECSEHDELQTQFVGVVASDVASMLGSALAKAYSTFTDEQKSKVSFALFIAEMNNQAIKFNHQLGNKDHE